MPSALALVVAVQAAIDGKRGTFNVFGIGETVHRPGDGPVPDRAKPYVLVGCQLRWMVDEVGRAWHELFRVGPPGKLVVIGTPGYLYEALPLNRTPSPGWVLPSWATPSYSAPLASSVAAVRLMDSSPSCAQNIAARFTVVQPASRSAVLSPLLCAAARAAPRPGKARLIVATSISCLLDVPASPHVRAWMARGPDTAHAAG